MMNQNVSFIQTLRRISYTENDAHMNAIINQLVIVCVYYNGGVDARLW